jgi:serine/threonine protein kinase
MQTPNPPSPASLSESWPSSPLEEPEVDLPAAESAPDPLIGTTLIETYKVDRVLAEGGMGCIYEAHHTRMTEKRFAIKVLRPELVHNALIRARFEREMRAVARISHPGVLSIVDVGTSAGGSSFMVSEHLNGLDLLAYLQRFGALSNERAIHMGCRIAEALEATHAQGVIHRDVKPSNVFLLGAFEPLGPEWDGVKLIDFGLSRFESRNEELTKSGMVMGTPAYMAPEQARGLRTDHLTDVYGVGAVLYAAATGVPPFREENQQQTLIAAMSRDPLRPRELNPSISEALEVVIQRAMSKRPEERHPSMSALRLALSNLERGTRSVHAAHGRDGDSSVRSVRLRFVALAGTALLLALLAMASALSGITALCLEASLVSVTWAKVLLPLALGAGVGLLLRCLLGLGRSIWGNSAKLFDQLPRLRAPLLAGLGVYGLGSLLLRVVREVLPGYVLSAALDRLPDVAWPGWSVLLSVAALLGAIAVAVHQRYWPTLSVRQRWVWGPLATASAGVLLLAIARPELFAHGVGSVTPTAGVGSAGAASGGADLPSLPSLSNAPIVVAAWNTDAGADAGAGASAGASAGATEAPPPLGSLDAGGAPEVLEPSPPVGNAGVPSSVPALVAARAHAPPAPAEHLAVAPTPIAASTPVKAATSTRAATAATPRGGGPLEALKAKALAASRRTPELTNAVHIVEQLLKIAPDKASDPVVRSILRKAAVAEGQSSRDAFRVMSNSMGSKGPDLLYDLMLEQPALAERAKLELRKFRVRKHFTPALAIAYDLRFSPSCGSRYSLLDRASEVGDQRSIDTLSALLGKPEKCGRALSVPCLPRCRKEALGFTRSIERMTKRLRAGEREAKAH